MSVASRFPPMSARSLEAIRRSRRRPSVTQFDYLHLRCLVNDLEETLRAFPGVHDVLDVWCGSRPYEDLLPEAAKCIGLDVEGNPYGVADVVSDELLPFPDEAFDLVLCIEAFQWIPDPSHAVAEFRRVLRPGGTALVTLPFGFEYDREVPEARYTEHELRSLFRGWEDLAVRENGGRVVTWTVLTASILAGLERRLPGLARPLFAAAYTVLNASGLVLARAERRWAGGRAALPMNLTLTARRPHE